METEKQEENVGELEDKVPTCLECGADILRVGDLFCLKCEMKQHRDYLRDIDGAMNEPSSED